MVGNTSQGYRLICCHRLDPKLFEGVGRSLASSGGVEIETVIRLPCPRAVKTLMVKGGGRMPAGEAGLHSWR